MGLHKGEMIKCLDKGYVKFIGSMGDEEEIVEAARMSTGRGFVSWDPYRRCKQCEWIDGHEGQTDNCIMSNFNHAHNWQPFPRGDLGFLEFMYSNKHMTPFEMPELCIEVRAPIFVFREWHRHRTQSYNEFSARYAQMPNEHYIPALERIVKQSLVNKQGSSDEGFDDDFSNQIRCEIERQQIEIYGTYDAWIGNGVANEIARVNTPVSRYSKMRAKTDLRNWLGFLLLRMAPNAQWEIRQYANALADFIKILYPRVYDLFEEYTLHSVTFSRTEMAVLRQIIQETREQASGFTGRLGQLSEDALGGRAKTFLGKLA
jgi:thymidylate synthase (FAD)